eukprot:3826079-Rhodomonas_salina.1
MRTHPSKSIDFGSSHHSSAPSSPPPSLDFPTTEERRAIATLVAHRAHAAKLVEAQPIAQYQTCVGRYAGHHIAARRTIGGPLPEAYENDGCCLEPYAVAIRRSQYRARA